MADPNEIPPPPPDPTLYFPQQAQAQQPQQPSTLDLLRRRMASELENEQAQRLSDLGNALLTSRSRSLFGALGEGFRAQDEGTRARIERLRQLADTERQAAEQSSQEQYRREQLEIERQRRDYERDPRNPRNILYGAQADYYRQGPRGTSGQLTERDIAAIGDRANRFAASQVREPTPNSPEAVRDTPEARETRARQRADIARQYIAEQYRLLGRPVPDAVQAPPADVRAPPAPAARIDARGNPIR